jgi:hypothetical protein
MKCEDCVPLLDLFFDGELARREADAVAAHLGGCAPCSAEYQARSDEEALYLRHECGEVDVPAFWDGLMRKVGAEARPSPPSRAARLRRRLALALAAPRFTPAVTAAMLLVAVALTAAAMRYFGPRPEPPAAATAGRGDEGINVEDIKDEGISKPFTPAPRAETAGETPGAVPGRGVRGESAGAGRGAGGSVGKTRPDGARPEVAGAAGRARRTLAADSRDDAAPERLVREAEQKYLEAIAILSRDVGRRRPRMAPERLARFERTLAVIDRAIADTRGAAREHPRDPVAAQYMLAAYAKKVEVLREMARD